MKITKCITPCRIAIKYLAAPKTPFFGFIAKITAAQLLLALPLTAAAEVGLNIELLAGEAHHEGHRFEGDDSSFGLRAGYSFNPYFTLEASYQDFGAVDRSWAYRYFHSLSQEFSTTTLTFGLKGSLPLFNHLAIVGRAGVAKWNHEYKESGASTLDSLSFYRHRNDDGSAPYYGAGFEYQLSNHFHIGFEYSVFEFDVGMDNEPSDYTINKTGIYLGYRF